MGGSESLNSQSFPAPCGKCGALAVVPIRVATLGPSIVRVTLKCRECGDDRTVDRAIEPMRPADS